MIFKLIIPASEIPEESLVTKINGSKPYTLRSQIEVYGTQRQTIKADDGCKFLVSENGNCNAISGNTELVWHCNPEQLDELVAYHLTGD